MIEDREQKLLKDNQELRKRLSQLEDNIENGIPIYQYSKISNNILNNLVDIDKKIDKNIFEEWFNKNEKIDNSIVIMLEKLIEDNRLLIDSYSKEDLKVNFIIPILNSIHFKSYENQFRDFYESSMEYKTKKFIFRGTTDFMVSKGLFKIKKPYFFIQEFKKGQQDGYPESQLLAELISAVELNDWSTIRGAYIVGENWNFVVLEKLGENKYQYFVSYTFHGTNIEDLKDIYNNLLFVKNEITQMIKED